MISLKLGSKIKGLQPEIILGLVIMHGVFEKNNLELVLTEGTGSKHMLGSLHYKGLAVDIRSHDIPNQALKYQILQECVYALGNDFDLILEGLNTPGEHLHLEFDPQ